jgi:hypothetical protein
MENMCTNLCTTFLSLVLDGSETWEERREEQIKSVWKQSAQKNISQLEYYVH